MTHIFSDFDLCADVGCPVAAHSERSVILMSRVVACGVVM